MRKNLDANMVCPRYFVCGLIVVFGETFWAIMVDIQVFPSPTGYTLTTFSFSY